MKLVTIIADCHIPGETPDDAPRTLFEGSTLNVDDNIAGLLIVGGKARKAEEGAKVVDTTKARLAAIDAKAKEAAKSPQEHMAALMGAAIAQALAAAKAQPPAPAA